MTREEILRKRLQMARRNLSCCSYYIGKPKEGMEKEYEETAAEIKILETWLKEFHSTRTDSTREFVGHISVTTCDQTYDGKPSVYSIEFEVDTGDDYQGDRRTFRVGEEVQNWIISGKFDIERERRDSRLVKITVDKIEFVHSIEWAVTERETA
jgi:hypothetical protein